MDDVEKMKSFLESSEGKESMNRFIQDENEKRLKQEEIIKEIFSNNNYVEWINSFTDEKGGFTDNDWLYFPDKLNKNDLDNVDKLYLFYEGIERYTTKNFIYPIPCEFGCFYRIKINGIGYEVGMMSGQGTLFFVRRVPMNSDYFIDINDIINDKKQDNTESIMSDLDYLSNTIKNLYKRGVPFEAISKTINMTMREIIDFERDNENPKVYKKNK